MVLNGKNLVVKDVMREVQTINIKASFKEALAQMICKRTNSLIVVNDEGVFEGMINARTLIQESVPKYLGEDITAAHFATEAILRDEVAKVANESISKIMEAEIVTVRENESLVKAAMIVAAENQVRIPVLSEDSKPVGLLTRTELKQVIGVFLGIDGCFSE